MVRAARARRIGLGLIAALPIALLASPASAGLLDADGDVFLTLTNDDADAERLGGELIWVEPLTGWLKAELGASYYEFDRARWGYGTLGAHLRLPDERTHLSARYEAGAGRGVRGAYDHQIAEFDAIHALVPGRIFVNTGFQLIRVDGVHENLVQLGFGLVPLDWLQLQVDYHDSVFGGEGIQAWSARSDVRVERTRLFGGYTRSEDTIDLRSIGGGRREGRATHEVFLGVEVPLGRHSLTLAGTRHESRFDVRYSMSLTFRWNLFFRAGGDVEAYTPKRGRRARAYARRSDPFDARRSDRYDARLR